MIMLGIFVPNLTFSFSFSFSFFFKKKMMIPHAANVSAFDATSNEGHLVIIGKNYTWQSAQRHL